MINKVSKVGLGALGIAKKGAGSKPGQLVLGATALAGYGTYNLMNATSKTLTGNTMAGNAINPFAGKAIQGYGKRGIDANRLSTDGLVQGLHGNRRK